MNFYIIDRVPAEKNEKYPPLFNTLHRCRRLLLCVWMPLPPLACPARRWHNKYHIFQVFEIGAPEPAATPSPAFVVTLPPGATVAPGAVEFTPSPGGIGATDRQIDTPIDLYTL